MNFKAIISYTYLHNIQRKEDAKSKSEFLSNTKNLEQKTLTLYG